MKIEIALANAPPNRLLGKMKYYNYYEILPLLLVLKLIYSVPTHRLCVYYDE